MAQIDFLFNGNLTTIQCNINDKFKDITNKYASKTENNINKVYYLYSCRRIENYELTFNDISNEIDKERKKMNIQIINNNNNNKTKSEQIIRPKCGDDIRIKYNENTIVILLYTSYCNTCKLYICIICEKEHNNQSSNLILKYFNSLEIISYEKIIPEEEEIKKKIKELKEIINIFKENLDEILNKLNNIKEKMKKNYKINKDYK